MGLFDGREESHSKVGSRSLSLLYSLKQANNLTVVKVKLCELLDGYVYIVDGLYWFGRV